MYFFKMVVKKQAKLIILAVYLQVISLAGWVNIMYYVQDAHTFWDWIYFVALIVVRILQLFYQSVNFT